MRGRETVLEGGPVGGSDGCLAGGRSHAGHSREHALIHMRPKGMPHECSAAASPRGRVVQPSLRRGSLAGTLQLAVQSLQERHCCQAPRFGAEVEAIGRLECLLQSALMVAQEVGDVGPQSLHMLR